jgi:hypothetical protein
MTDNPRDRASSYLATLAAFGTGVVGLVVGGRLSGQSLPDRYRLLDLALGGLATHKFTRLLSKDAVTTPLRMPFTEFEEPAGSAEVNEQPRSGHPEHAIGELISCPFCLAPWVSVGYVAGLALAPRWARTWAAVFSVVGASDFLQHAYAHVRAD